MFLFCCPAGCSWIVLKPFYPRKHRRSPRSRIQHRWRMQTRLRRKRACWTGIDLPQSCITRWYPISFFGNLCYSWSATELHNQVISTLSVRQRFLFLNNKAFCAKRKKLHHCKLVFAYGGFPGIDLHVGNKYITVRIHWNRSLNCLSVGSQLSIRAFDILVAWCNTLYSHRIILSQPLLHILVC